MTEQKQKPGRFRIGSALIWGAALAWTTWQTDQGFFPSVGAFFTGALTGWTVASLLRWIAFLNAGYGIMGVTGVALGIAIASGAVIGLNLLLQFMNPGEFEIKWEELGFFLMSWNAVPAAILGGVIGVFVRYKIPRKRDES